MTVETVSFLNDLNVSYPGADDVKKEGDDHIRNIKIALQATFPGMSGRAWRQQTKAANYTVLVTDNMSLFNIATTGITLALTAAASLGSGHMFLVHANGFDVTIDPNAAETINGAATFTVPNGRLGVVFCNGTSFVAALLSVSSTSNFKIGTFTRDLTTASGTQAVTGVGFQATAVIFLLGLVGADGASVGLSNGTIHSCIYEAGDRFQANTSNALYYSNSAGSTLYAGVVSAFAADGFTVTWTKTGAPTGTATVTYLALRWP